MPLQKRATIKDVAARANVSYQTVSRVINNSERVSDATRNRVMAAIEELNYRPSLAARSLPGHRTFVIGLIIPYTPDYLIRDPNLLGQISGADAEACLRGYNLLLSTTGNSNLGLNAYERFMNNHVADGALVVETAASAAGNLLLQQRDYPYVVLGYESGTANSAFVHNDDIGGAKKATEYLLKKGHRRIGIINGPPIGAVLTMQRRVEGYQQALAEAGVLYHPELMTYGDYTRASGVEAVKQLMALPERPTAIFALNDRMAIGAIAELQRMGLRVPDDIAVVGFDDIPSGADFSPALTTVRQPSRDIGQRAAQLLFRLINGEPVMEREIVLPSEFVARQSA